MASHDASTVSDFTEYTQDEDDNSCLASQASTTDTEILRRERPKANEELWSHTRKAKGSEEARDRHYH